jgi:hypothetical protein
MTSDMGNDVISASVHDRTVIMHLDEIGCRSTPHDQCRELIRYIINTLDTGCSSKQAVSHLLSNWPPLRHTLHRMYEQIDQGPLGFHILLLLLLRRPARTFEGGRGRGGSPRWCNNLRPFQILANCLAV